MIQKQWKGAIKKAYLRYYVADIDEILKYGAAIDRRELPRSGYLVHILRVCIQI